MDDYLPAAPSNFSLPAVPKRQARPKQPSKDWPHAPVHRLGENGIYIVTAATLYKAKLFDSNEKLRFLEGSLLSLAKQSGWQLEAWAVFPNHYHFVARGSAQALPLPEMIREFHSNSARELNRLDNTEGRTVWYNYWDTRLTHQYSYLARLSYVHRNAVKHGLVVLASQYPWCSAAWFERVASPAQVKTIYGFKIDRVEVEDDF